MTTDTSGGWDTITDGWGKRCVLPALKQKPKPTREEILKKWDAYPQAPSGMLAQAAVNQEAETKFLEERKAAAKAELAARKAARDAIKLEAIAAARAIRAAKREKLLANAADHVKPRLRRELRIGKCPICRRRYGYTPTEAEKLESNTTDIIFRECDRHGEPVKAT